MGSLSNDLYRQESYDSLLIKVETQTILIIFSYNFLPKHFFRRDFLEMVKASTMDLLREICRLGQGEIPEHKLLHNLDISHGYFCKLRKQLTDAGRLLVTHPNRKAHYNVRLEWTNELFDSWSDDVDISSEQCQTA